jgi:endoglucanase
MNRREFVVSAGAAVAAGLLGPVSAFGAAEAKAAPTARRLPRWRGFNLLEKFVKRPGGNPPFRESDFRWMAEWGFDFARLPSSYLCWTDPGDWLKLLEPELKHVDEAIEFGRKHGVHINLNLHRAPGYCVNPPKEPRDLWSDELALDACAVQWGQLAKRYKRLPNDRLSFDLLNEPPDIPEATYVRVVKRLVEAIRAEDANRLIIADGLRYGTRPVPGLIELGVAQSTRGYEPMAISHYKASWVQGADRWNEPAWPMPDGSRGADNKEALRRQRIEPWKQLEAKGVGVHVGEWGAFNRTPHRVVLAWMRDCLDLWKEAGWGWALWNFRGSFGVLDSGRSDVAYEEFHGHKLDREMLNLLQSA